MSGWWWGVLALVGWGWAPAVAGASPVGVEDVGQDAPAVSLDHRLEITVGSRTTVTERWTVRVDDPTRLVAAPPGMEGASAAGAVVRGGVLELPSGFAAGGTVALVATRTLTGPQSGLFIGADGVDVAASSVTIKSSAPVRVWADAACDLVWEARAVTAKWADRPGSDPPRLLWSTYGSWADAGAATAKSAASKLVKPWELGRAVGEGISGLSIEGAAQRVFQEVAYDPARPEGWDAARSADQVGKGRSGSAAERGLVLLSLLEFLGYDARPALFRTAAEGIDLPLVVPVPSALTHPVIAVLQDSGTVWIDPSGSAASADGLPVRMAGGAIAWRLESDPELIEGRGAAGVVHVAASLDMQQNGSASFEINVRATGSADQALRDALGGLDEGARSAVVHGWLTSAWPGVARSRVVASGLEDARKPVRISVQGVNDVASVKIGDGALLLDAHPMVAPHLAAALPAGMLVVEDLAVRGPGGMIPLPGAVDDVPYQADARLGLSVHGSGSALTVHTEAERPHVGASASRLSSAGEWLVAQRGVGAEVVWLDPAATLTAFALPGANKDDPAETVATEAVLWYRAGDAARADKVLARGVKKFGAAPLADVLTLRSDPSDPAAWLGLHAAARTEPERLLAVRGLEAAGHDRDAWILSASLIEAVDPSVSVASLLLAARLQPDTRPDLAVDPEGGPLWLSPDVVLARLEPALGSLAPDDEAHVEAVVLRAAVALERGDVAAAEVALQPLVDHPRVGPLARVLLAQVGASSGLTLAEVLAEVDGAVPAMPSDDRTRSAAAEVLGAVGAWPEALAEAQEAARIAWDDQDKWAQVVEVALRGGDMEAALLAARRASDLAPTSADAGRRLSWVAALAGDEAGARLGQQRSKSSGPVSYATLDAALIAGGPLAERAILEFHDEAVRASADLRARRAAVRLSNGDRVGALRDAHAALALGGSGKAAGLLAAAGAGQIGSDVVRAQLDAAAKVDGFARRVRMEIGLLTGSSDPLADAKGLPDDARATQLLALAADPDSASRLGTGWPAGLADPPLAIPPGYKACPALALAPGVAAACDPERGVAVLRSAGVGVLPPPLSPLFVPVEPAIRRIPSGGQILRLDGGVAPIYAAVRVGDGFETYGLGFSPEAAERALLSVK
jgi:tetratricopeptide (TPR) repeat protein